MAVVDDFNPDAPLTLGEVSRRSGCSASALRYYEAEGLLRPLPRPPGGRRTYAPGCLHTLDMIVTLRGAGFGIGDIRKVLSSKQPGESLEQRTQRLRAVLAELDGVLKLRRAALERAENTLSEWQTALNNLP
jgi:MerR family transcriptional regulator, copper efflux regulator